MSVIFYSELCVVTQESQLSSGTAVPPLVTLAPRAVLTLVRPALSHSGGGGAAPHLGGWKVTTVFLSREKPNRNS